MSLRDKIFSDAHLFRRVMSLYPPYLGAGIRVKSVAKDFREVEVTLKLSGYNRNALGTHFGGSLYAMTDPFYVLMLIANLGKGYVVWDKAAAIQFERPGTGTVTAQFTLTDADIAAAKTATETGLAFTPTYVVEVRAEDGQRVARIEKQIYIRKKQASAAR
jgi:hypothetical protein